MALGIPERRWPNSTKPVFASARTGLRKFEIASKRKRAAAAVRNQPRFRYIGFLPTPDSATGGHLARAPLGCPTGEVSRPLMGLLLGGAGGRLSRGEVNPIDNR